MADILNNRHSAASALEGIAAPGRYGRATGPPGVTAREVVGCGLASIIARPDRTEPLAAVVGSVFGVVLPSRAKRVEGQSLSLIWAGSNQWLALALVAPPRGMEALLEPLAEHASIVDQTHARLILRLAGPRVRDALAKGLPIDLHPRAFAPGDTALTVLSTVNVQIWQLGTAPTYDLSVARGFAGSIWNWLVASASEFGLEHGM